MAMAQPWKRLYCFLITGLLLLGGCAPAMRKAMQNEENKPGEEVDVYKRQLLRKVLRDIISMIILLLVSHHKVWNNSRVKDFLEIY